MNSYPKELEYLKRYLTPDGEIVCRPEAARRLLEATNDESDYIAPEMAQWTFDLGSQSVKPACIANDNCRIVFSESELIALMPKSIVVGQEAGSRYELCLMNSSKYEQEFDLELLDEGNPQCYYYASYKKPKRKRHVYEFGPMANKAELLAKMLTCLIEENVIWVVTNEKKSKITGLKTERDNPDGIWQNRTDYSFE